MSYRRVIARNGLADGSYTVTPELWLANVNTFPHNDGHLEVSKARRERLGGLEHRATMLAGDLRRLESDAVDEKAICNLISGQTGVNADDVAAVLAAFMSSV